MQDAMKKNIEILLQDIKYMICHFIETLSLQENNAGEYNVSDVDITRENCRVLTSS
jgi:hypothetical protein